MTKRKPPKANTKPKQYTPDLDDIALDALGDETIAGLIDWATEPYGTFIKAAEDLGLAPQVVKRMMERIKSKYQPVLGPLQDVKTKDLVALLEDRAHRALLYLDDQALAKASAKDLAIIAGITIEKRNLLRGEPTQILSVEERHTLNELIPLIVAEGERRNMTIDLTADEVQVIPDTQRLKARHRLSHKDARKKASQERKKESGEP